MHGKRPTVARGQRTFIRHVHPPVQVCWRATRNKRRSRGGTPRHVLLLYLDSAASCLYTPDIPCRRVKASWIYAGPDSALFTTARQASISGVRGAVGNLGTGCFRRDLLERGVSEAFVEQAMATLASTMWYPTADELLNAHVIT
jgi:hypothetical protein